MIKEVGSIEIIIPHECFQLCVYYTYMSHEIIVFSQLYFHPMDQKLWNYLRQDHASELDRKYQVKATPYM